MGCDVAALAHNPSMYAYFNPRTHRGVRLLDSVHVSPDGIISIHAPIVGCDSCSARLTFRLNIFQSTHPSWGATCREVILHKYSKAYFNPRTHRGVRLDFCVIFLETSMKNFNPRTHRGVRQQK